MKRESEVMSNMEFGFQKEGVTPDEKLHGGVEPEGEANCFMLPSPVVIGIVDMPVMSSLCPHDRFIPFASA